MPLTGTVDADNARVDLFVDFTAEAGTQTSASLFRRIGDVNAPDQYVRGLFGTTLLGEQAYVSDHEAPLDAQIWYVAVAQDGTTMVAGPFTIPGNGYVWMKDPGRPWADVRLDLCVEPDRGLDPCPEEPVVTDTFSRTETDEWGDADSGQTWTDFGTPTDFSVSGGQGRHLLSAPAQGHDSQVPQVSADADITTDIGVDQVATGGPIQGALEARSSDPNNLYIAYLTFLTTGLLRISLVDRVAGVETTLATEDLVLTYTPGDMFTVRFQVDGTRLRARAWPAGTAEPTVWQVFATDAGFAAAGSAGTRSISDAANTNVAASVLYDNFQIMAEAPLTDDIAWVGFQDKSREMDAGLFPVLDKQRSTDVWARRKDLSTGCLFLTRSREAIDTIYDLYTAGGPLLFQIPAVYHMNNQYGITDRYYQPGDLIEQYISRDQRRPIRLWTAPLQTTDLPVGEPQGTDDANWCALNEAHETFADLTATGLTWGDIAQGGF